ncbi:hypothetical protein DDZ16_08680 [Marinilabilia rubra]|uniref:Uncharacterized protein n=1 Tax=Marinilabilia rubra TaxID=2162893 RepID=A0A2U2BA42_9BACT|nr:hypothetical protein DDZ16_08680 [Marinilabilia rubra]
MIIATLSIVQASLTLLSLIAISQGCARFARKNSIRWLKSLNSPDLSFVRFLVAQKPTKTIIEIKQKRFL